MAPRDRPASGEEGGGEDDEPQPQMEPQAQREADEWDLIQFDFREMARPLAAAQPDGRIHFPEIYNPAHDFAVIQFIQNMYERHLENERNGLIGDRILADGMEPYGEEEGAAEEDDEDFLDGYPNIDEWVPRLQRGLPPPEAVDADESNSNPAPGN